MTEEDTATVAVLGDRIEGFEPQDAIEQALSHSAEAIGIPGPTVRWIGTDALHHGDVDDLLADADGIWCAPGSPYRSLEGALRGIRFARERQVPFLGTCAGFQHAVIEIARNIAHLPAADHAEYGIEGGDLLIHELLCSLVGQRLDVMLVSDRLQAVYGTERATERYYCRFGLNPAYLHALQAAGLTVAGTDAADGQPRILSLEGHPFFVLTLFVPQTSSLIGRPHPLVTAFVTALAERTVSGIRAPA